jgi:hypothetical protein
MPTSLMLSVPDTGVDSPCHTARCSFYGFYNEPDVTIAIPHSGAASYDLQWDLSGAAWRLTAVSPPIMPDFRKGNGPSRLDGAAKPPPRVDGTTDMTGWFAVDPLPQCPHCPQVRLVEGATLDFKAPCAECQHVGENMICLTCFEVHCGRHVQGHMMQHHSATAHPIVCGMVDLSFWCYACNAYIHERNAHLRPLYELLCLAKFEEPTDDRN